MSHANYTQPAALGRRRTDELQRSSDYFNKRMKKGNNNNYDRNRPRAEELLPARLEAKEGQRVVRVYVEGYDDVAFWRGVFNDFESSRVTFEIAVPPRPDLAKGKRVVMEMIPDSSPAWLLCVDSDFDYLFGGETPVSKRLLGADYLFHTYTYATENYLCYAPALRTVCTKATKNDARIFDFEGFLAEYSKIIYPVFAWYAYSALLGDEHVFKLIEFKNTVRLNYLEVSRNGQGTLDWVAKNVRHRLDSLRHHHPEHVDGVNRFMSGFAARGIQPENTYLFMHGHTLMDNVVMPMLSAVCDKLKLLADNNISTSAQRGVALGNEISNYRNSLLNVRDTLVYNEDYKECFLYRRLHGDIRDMLQKAKLL